MTVALWPWILYLPLGALVGLLAGFFGIGGGLLQVPILAIIFTESGFLNPLRTATGTSLGVIALTLLMASYAHHRKKNINWYFVQRLIPGLVIGSMLGRYLAVVLPASWVAGLFTIIVSFIASKWLFQFKTFNFTFSTTSNPVVILGVASLVIGTVGALLGIGGSLLLVPFLVSWGQGSLLSSIGTASICGFVVTMVGAVCAIQTEDVYFPAFASLALASMITATIGVHLAHRVSANRLRRLFAILLLLCAVSMLLRLL